MVKKITYLASQEALQVSCDDGPDQTDTLIWFGLVICTLYLPERSIDLASQVMRLAMQKEGEVGDYKFLPATGARKGHDFLITRKGGDLANLVHVLALLMPSSWECAREEPAATAAIG